jgi:hypothetical protein
MLHKAGEFDSRRDRSSGEGCNRDTGFTVTQHAEQVPAGHRAG